MDLLRHPIMGDPGYWFQDGGRLTPFSTAPKVQCIDGCVIPFIRDYPPRLTGRGMFLWSVGISFKHPVSGESIQLSIPEPDNYKALRDHLSTT
jgi:23S rRNA-/tRNA-specific pseudouridylate synthase